MAVLLVGCTEYQSALGRDAIAADSDPGAETGPPPVGFSFTPSNGVRLMDGAGESSIVLSGTCSIDTTQGAINCSAAGGFKRANGPGILSGIGFEVRPPIAPFCAGSTAPAPSLAVFSVGSLSIEPTAQISVTGLNAFVLVAKQKVDIRGYLLVNPGTGGGFTAKTGPAPGGGGGAGGATTGGVSGEGAAGGAQLVAQEVPLCGGSGATNAPGGGAMMLVAGERVTFAGPTDCGLVAMGGAGRGSLSSSDPASGGGAGGTILVEAPVVLFPKECTVRANGGGGGGGSGECSSCTPCRPADAADGGLPGAGGGCSCIGGTGGYGGAVLSPTAPPGKGTARGSTCLSGSGGAGGGAAGFIRFRTNDCSFAGTTTNILPAAACNPL